MKNISIERLQDIEKERQETANSSAFQAWCQEMNIGRLWSNPEPILNARQMNSAYDYTKLNLN